MFKINRLSLIFLAALLVTQSVRAEEVDVYDPWEPMNRKTFWFNDKFDYYLLEPLAKGYDTVMPEKAQTSVGNFFRNLRYPSYLLSDLLQLEFGQAGDHTVRFLLNTTLGLLGLFDFAAEVGFEEVEEDFGTALASFGVGEGPYFVIPFIGPSNVRDAVGLAVDTLINPLTLFSYSNASSDAKLAVSIGGYTLKTLNLRSAMLDNVETAKQSSMDYYLFMQGAYQQYRRGVISGGIGEEEDPFADDKALEAEMAE